MRLYQRLQTIKNIKKPHKETVLAEKAEEQNAPYFGGEWESIAGLVKKRTVIRELPRPPLELTDSLKQALSLLIPDFSSFREDREKFPQKENLLFFDLETTGLSGGAGTLAFLAAFGRIEKAEKFEKMTLTQYLLLDYPGENDFLEAVLREFDTPFVITYNGKCFDYPVLKSRCLINGFDPPIVRHIDLLHPARFLWEKTLFSCSQAEIEVSILGLDRTDDISGAFAPEIWFSFLKSGEQEPLLKICDHNVRDIIGLSVLFMAFTDIACDPLSFSSAYHADIENIALRWRSNLKRGEKNGENQDKALYKISEILLDEAARRGHPKASLILGLDLMKKGLYEQARTHLASLSVGDFPNTIKASALRTLSIDAKRRLKDKIASLSYIETALSLENTGQTLKTACERYRNRLLKF